MANGSTATETEIIRAEHDSAANVQLKKVGVYGWDTNSLQWVKLNVDSNGDLNVSIDTSNIPTIIYNGKKIVTTAGTRVTLATSQAIQSVTIKALAENTGIIYVGDSSVSSTTGFALVAGDTVSMDIANLATVNLDSSVSGEGVTYIAVQ